MKLKYRVNDWFDFQLKFELRYLSSENFEINSMFAKFSEFFSAEK